jgi:hypothetical protein
MTHRMSAGVAIVFLLMGTSPVAAQGVASSFDQLSVLVKAGDKITVVDPAGRETAGRIGLLSRDRLTLVTPAGPRELSEADVLQIRQRRGDSLKNGALIGAAVGAGGSLALLAIANHHLSGSDVIPAGHVSAMVFLPGLGAAAGVGIDALITRQHVIYRTPPSGPRFSVSPLLVPGRRGAAVTVRF